MVCVKDRESCGADCRRKKGGTADCSPFAWNTCRGLFLFHSKVRSMNKKPPGVLFLLISVFYSSRLAKRNYRVYELSHTGMGKTILFYPDRIECANDGEAAKTYYYSQISRVKESSGLSKRRFRSVSKLYETGQTALEK